MAGSSSSTDCGCGSGATSTTISPAAAATTASPAGRCAGLMAGLPGTRDATPLRRSRTSAAEVGFRPSLPWKMMSCMCSPRRLLALCSPSTQVMASTTLLLPQPLGPTMAVTPRSKARSARSGKLLNPEISRRCSRIYGRPCAGYRRDGQSVAGATGWGKALEELLDLGPLPKFGLGRGLEITALASSWLAAGLGSLRLHEARQLFRLVEL